MKRFPKVVQDAALSGATAAADDPADYRHHLYFVLCNVAGARQFSHRPGDEPADFAASDQTDGGGIRAQPTAAIALSAMAMAGGASQLRSFPAISGGGHRAYRLARAQYDNSVGRQHAVHLAAGDSAGHYRRRQAKLHPRPRSVVPGLSRHVSAGFFSRLP